MFVKSQVPPRIWGREGCEERTMAGQQSHVVLGKLHVFKQHCNQVAVCLED